MKVIVVAIISNTWFGSAIHWALIGDIGVTLLALMRTAKLHCI